MIRALKLILILNVFVGSSLTNSFDEFIDNNEEENHSNSMEALVDVIVVGNNWDGTIDVYEHKVLF